MFYDRGQHHEFVSVVKELEAPQGELTKDQVYPFEFPTVEKQYVRARMLGAT
jgi:vacuolar protein sorting-associated protein 26